MGSLSYVSYIFICFLIGENEVHRFSQWISSFASFPLACHDAPLVNCILQSLANKNYFSSFFQLASCALLACSKKTKDTIKKNHIWGNQFRIVDMLGSLCQFLVAVLFFMYDMPSPLWSIEISHVLPWMRVQRMSDKERRIWQWEIYVGLISWKPKMIDLCPRFVYQRV